MNARVTPEDADRVGRLFAAHGRQIRAYLRRCTGSDAAADDLTADAFVFALRNMHTFVGDDDDARRWLMVVARTRFLAWRRDVARSREILSDDPRTEDGAAVYAAADDEALGSLTADAVAAAVDRLPSDVHRQWVRLRYLRDMEWNAASTALGRDPANTSRLNSRALSALRKDPHLRREVLGEAPVPADGTPRPWGLRQFHGQVAALTEQGLSGKEIAARLGLKPRQVFDIRKTAQGKAAA